MKACCGVFVSRAYLKPHSFLSVREIGVASPVTHIVDMLFAWAERAVFHDPVWMGLSLSLILLGIWYLGVKYVMYIARRAGNWHREGHPVVDPADMRALQRRLNEVERNLQSNSAHLSIWPDVSMLQPGMVPLWNGHAWTGHPTTSANNPMQPIRRQGQGRGKKSAIEVAPLPTSWDRIRGNEDDDEATR